MKKTATIKQRLLRILFVAFWIFIGQQIAVYTRPPSIEYRVILTQCNIVKYISSPYRKGAKTTIVNLDNLLGFSLCSI